MSRGFAAMSKERLASIARKGGRAAHASGAAHRFTPSEARAAGKKGGKKVAIERGRSFYVEIGRKGGHARHKKKEGTNAT